MASTDVGNTPQPLALWHQHCCGLITTTPLHMHACMYTHTHTHTHTQASNSTSAMQMNYHPMSHIWKVPGEHNCRALEMMIWAVPTTVQVHWATTCLKSCWLQSLSLQLLLWWSVAVVVVLGGVFLEGSQRSSWFKLASKSQQIWTILVFPSRVFQQGPQSIDLKNMPVSSAFNPELLLLIWLARNSVILNSCSWSDWLETAWSWTLAPDLIG